MVIEGLCPRGRGGIWRENKVSRKVSVEAMEEKLRREGGVYMFGRVVDELEQGEAFCLCILVRGTEMSEYFFYRAICLLCLAIGLGVSRGTRSQSSTKSLP